MIPPGGVTGEQWKDLLHAEAASTFFQQPASADPTALNSFLNTLVLPSSSPYQTAVMKPSLTVRPFIYLQKKKLGLPGVFPVPISTVIFYLWRPEFKSGVSHK